MKSLNIIYGILILVAIAVFTLCGRKSDVNKEPLEEGRSGTAILMTGAAARIPQEAALLEELYNRGLFKDVVFISGVSSGALNAVMLNGILSGKMTWKEYKEILFNLNKGRFDKLGISIDNILMKGIIKRLEAFASEAPDLVPLSYVYIPEFQNRFLLFNFDNLREQFIITSHWAKDNDPVPLADFLKNHTLKRIRMGPLPDY